MCSLLRKNTKKQLVLTLFFHTQALCQAAPFLPRLVDPAQAQALPATSPEASLLDRNFRLVREDMVGPLRAELKALGIAQQASVSGQQGVKAPQIKAGTPSSRNVYAPVQVLGVAQWPRPCVMLSVTLPKSNKAARMKTKKERLEYWTDFGRGTLPIDSLVCLVRPGHALAFGTVVRRDAAEMAEERPMVGVAFENGSEMLWVLQQMGCGQLQEAVLVQVSCM